MARKARIVSGDRRRRSVRLTNYDYAQAGAYFVTICAHSRQLLFENTVVRAIAERCWLAIPEHFPLVTLDEWVVMPNHVHGIIVIADQHDDARRNNNDETNESHRRGVQLNAPTANNMDINADDDTGDSYGSNSETNESHRRGVQLNAPTANNNDCNVPRDPANRHSLISPHRNTLAVIVRTYKGAVTTICRRAGYPNFRWQRSYYERVIRDDAELNSARQYIINNSTHWNRDEHAAR
jgi:putative transposase